MDPRIVKSKGMSVAVVWTLAVVGGALSLWLLAGGRVGSAVLWALVGGASLRLALRRCVMDGSTWHIRGFWQTFHVPVEDLTAVKVDDPMLSFAAHTVTVGFGHTKIGVASFANDDQAQEAAAAMLTSLPDGHPLRAAS